MKLLRAIRKWMRGLDLEPSEERRLNAMLFEARIISILLCIVLAFVFVLVDQMEMMIVALAMATLLFLVRKE